MKYLAEKAVGRDDPVLTRADRPDLIGVGANSWVGHSLGCYAEGFSLTSERGLNFKLTEWMCRCGLYGHLPALTDAVDALAGSIDGDGICRADIDENALRGISTYGGQQLEIDWKSETRRLADITFRAALTLKLATR